MKVGLRCAVAMGLGAAAISALAGPVLSVLGFDRELVSLVQWQGPAAALGLLPPMLLVVFRVHASLNERAGFITALAAAGAVAGGAAAMAVVRWQSADPDPEAAAVGVLLALAAVNWTMLALAWLGLRSLRDTRAPVAEHAASVRQAWKDMWFFGWPIGAVVLMDSALTLSSTLAMGRWWIDTVPVHSAVVLWMAVGLIVPLGIAQAGVQNVAIANARGDIAMRNRAAGAALALGGIYGVLAGVALNSFAVEAGALLLPGVDADAQTRAQLRELMLPGAIVLAAEGVIVIAAAVLRGVGLTRTTLIQALVGYAAFSTGGQYLFAGVLGQGAVGLWWGLVLGFGVTAVAVTLHCIRQLGIGARRTA